MANETPDYFYTRSNPPTASDVGAVPLDGSVAMSGALKGTDGTNTYQYYGEHNVTCGTSDITAETTALATGCYYDVYK